MKFIVQQVRVLEVEAENKEEALDKAQKAAFWTSNVVTVTEDHPLAQLRTGK